MPGVKLDNFFRKAFGVFQPVSEDYEEDRKKVNNLDSFEDFMKLNGADAPAELRGSNAADALADRLFKERLIGKNNLMDIHFLTRGAEIVRTVCRIVNMQSGYQPMGSGFLVGPGLLMTNHHVLPNKRAARNHCAEFEFELRGGYPNRDTVCFRFVPDDFFLSDETLDYCIVAVELESDNVDGRVLAEYHYNELKPVKQDLLKGEHLSIIQHPKGLPKMVAFRDNQIVEIDGFNINYTTDTFQGSSGSPVANDRWDIVALHKKGVAKTNERGEVMLEKGGVWRNRQDDPYIIWVANQGTIIDDVMIHAAGKPLPQSAQEKRDALFKHFPDLL